MGSTSPTELAAAILGLCLRGESVPDRLIEPLVRQAAGTGAEAEEASTALFQGIAEPLADRFDPSLCDAYAALFSRVLAPFVDHASADGLRTRYERIRRPLPAQHEPRRVVVLSRVTLGADVAITSVLLDAVKRRFPAAQILLAGSRKNWELFAADPRIGHLEVHYRRRGSLRERLAAGAELREKLSGRSTLVVDPDSRLTQLGLLPVCPDEDYVFFESRSAGGGGTESLGQLASRWAGKVFSLQAARPYIAPAPPPVGGKADITVSYGVGENSAKRLGDPYEARLLRGLLETGHTILIDKGAGGEESERVERAVADSGGAGRIGVWKGAFAAFASRIAQSRLYIGYDSAGQHAAAAAGTPLVTVFSGYPHRRFFHRWRPVPSPAAISLELREAKPEEAANEVVGVARRTPRDAGIRRDGAKIEINLK